MLGVKQFKGDDMPRGPQGQKRPADTVANAIRVAKILTGEIEWTPEPKKRGTYKPRQPKSAEAISKNESPPASETLFGGSRPNGSIF
jgi:hypothetical protein